jgi:hypothetical protein
MLPEGAVRQKMTNDGLSPAEIDAFFSSSAEAASTPAETNPAKAELVKAESDGEPDSPPPSEPSSLPSTAPSTAPSTRPVSKAVTGGTFTKTDPRYETYKRMQGMLPEGAVRQKMTNDGISPDDIDIFISGDTPDGGVSDEPEDAPPPSEDPPGKPRRIFLECFAMYLMFTWRVIICNRIQYCRCTSLNSEGIDELRPPIAACDTMTHIHSPSQTDVYHVS